jgi:hypothetical protein
VLRVGLAGPAREFGVAQRREVAARVERRLQRDLFGGPRELPDTQARRDGDAEDRRDRHDHESAPCHAVHRRQPRSG